MMKRILYSLASIACAAMAFTSCSNDDAMEGNVPEPVMQVTIEAGTPEVEAETRTELSGTIPMWSVGDKIGVVNESDAFETLTSTATAASKTTTFKGTVPMSTTTLYPFYPSANQGVNTDKNIKMDIPDLQHPTETSFDGAADMLIGKPIAVAAGVDIMNLKTPFARVIGVLKVNVKSVEAIIGENLEHLSVSVDKSEAAGFAGRVSLDVQNSKGLTSLYYNQSLKVSAEYAPEKQFALNGTNGAYLCVYPQTLAAGTILTISGTTSGHNFKKEITLKNPIEILPGKQINLNVTLNAEHISIRTSGAALPFVDDFSWLGGSVSIDSSNGKYTNGSGLYCDDPTDGLRLGSGKHGGFIETKFLNLSKPYTIKVTAKTYKTDNSQLIITVGSVTKTETLTATAQEFVIPMSAATDNEKIKFATEDAGNRRLYIQRIEVLDGQGGDVVVPPIINVTTTSPIAMGWIGGEGVINYTIDNPKQGVTIAATSNETWVNGFTYVNGTVKFNVDKNETATARKATITLTYGDAEPKTVEVKQDLKKPVELTVPATHKIEAAAGTYSFDYTLVNPDGSKMTAVAAADAGWITNIKVDEVNSEISFVAEENTTGASRMGDITLTYGAISKVVKITQVAAGASAVNTMTIDLSTMGFNDSAKVTTVMTDPINVAFAVGNNPHGTAPVYKSRDLGIRTYGGNTVTIGGKTIIKVVFTAKKAKNKIEYNGQPLSLVGNKWTWEDPNGLSNIVFNVSGTSGNIPIQVIEVTYK